ncbi:hypothetical protein BDN72DRAFT_898230 [Pluteus cervinus]|uniref:Uncharacterized protein n=1 Tax=Pluteus cervinus TaxID=181527 RepID=A0ACD3ARK3_9AGAR|nr:hypothetical protein BDN72DRAFT_898230 [Pluteus cervinus]
MKENDKNLDADNKELLFLTTLLHGLPQLSYMNYVFTTELEKFSAHNTTPEVEDLSRLLCILVRSEEVVAAIPAVTEGDEGKFNLILCWKSGASESQGREDDGISLSDMILPSEGEVVYPTSVETLKNMFLNNRSMSWERHANLVFHLSKRATLTNYKWLAHYLLLQNASHTLKVLTHPLHWNEIFGRLTFSKLNLEKLETPYPSAKGLGLLLSGGEVSAIKNLVKILGQPDTLPLIQERSLQQFLDEYSNTDPSLDLNEELVRQILVATHSVFHSALDLITNSYQQLVANPGCVLTDSLIYDHITSITSTFQPLLRGKFLSWMVDDCAFHEVTDRYMEITGPEENSVRVDCEQGPQIIGVKPRNLEDHSRECWFWLHSCFDTVHNVEQVVKRRKLKNITGLRFLDFSPDILSPSMAGGSTITRDWPDIISQRPLQESDHSYTYEEIMAFLNSRANTTGFEWVSQKEFVVHPELHFEVLLATLHFLAVTNTQLKGSSVPPHLMDIVSVFNGSLSIIGTSKPCCFTCSEIIQGLSSALGDQDKPSIYLTWSHGIGSPSIFPDVVPDSVRSFVLKWLGGQVFTLLLSAVSCAD